MFGKLSQRHRVIVRIWLPGTKSIGNNRGENVGHISVETEEPKGYMSLWPKSKTVQEQLQTGVIGQFFEKRPTHYMKNQQEDELAEGRDSELTLCFYSLSPGKIHKKWKTLKEETKSWTLLPKGRTGTHSCASLGLELLRAGGIERLLPKVFSLTGSKNSSDICSIKLAPSPGILGKLLVKAKQKECQEHKETKGYKYKGETNVENMNVQKVTNCLVM